MTVFLSIYIIIYTITICCLVYLLPSASPIDDNNNLFTFISKINTFNKLKPIIFTLLLSLSGLPPFLLFFLKFNYLTFLVFSMNPIIIFFVFIIFFLNMLYYVQVFFFKTDLFVYLDLNSVKKKPNYDLLFWIYLFTFCIFFSVSFAADIIYILKLL